MEISKKEFAGLLWQEYATWTTRPNRCALCWIPRIRVPELRFVGRLELAHIISRARGGANGNVIGNVLFLCSSCHGAQHMTGYIYDEVRWPDVQAKHLFRAKLELGELSIRDMATLSGYTPGYILAQTNCTLPPEIISERLRWAWK